MNPRAEYKTVTTEQEARIENIRMLFSDVYDNIEKLCKPSRETSLVLTKLEEAQFWAIKGITREKPNESENRMTDENGNLLF